MDDTCPSRQPGTARLIFRRALPWLFWTAAILALTGMFNIFETGDGAAAARVPVDPQLVGAAKIGIDPVPWHSVLTGQILFGSLLLLVCSAFFSASEIAFFSLHKLQLRTMRESTHPLDRLVGHLMKHPGVLLTSILMSNSIVNVMLSILFAAPVERLFALTFLFPAPAAYGSSLVVTTAALVFFGEILPKVLVVRSSDAFARAAAVPIYLVDRLLMPLRNGVIWITGVLFRATRFSEVRPAPFMTDEEFLSLISEGEAYGAIESEERQMIQGILEFNEVMLRELKVPRPDMVALRTTTTVGEALGVVRARRFSRMPVYEDDVDHIRGVLYAKDLLPSLERGEVDTPISELMRRPHYVPETMSVADFVKLAQKRRTHLAIVVDEFGGTEGLITLEDALREVVGEMGDDRQEEKKCPIVEMESGTYIVEGNFSLEDLEALTGVNLENDTHLTVAGYVMEMTDKIPEQGDQIAVDNVVFTVEEVDGKRVSQVRIEVPDRDEPVASEEAIS